MKIVESGMDSIKNALSFLKDNFSKNDGKSVVLIQIKKSIFFEGSQQENSYTFTCEEVSVSGNYIVFHLDGPFIMGSNILKVNFSDVSSVYTHDDKTHGKGVVFTAKNEEIIHINR
jgi:hypothetical protein